MTTAKNLLIGSSSASRRLTCEIIQLKRRFNTSLPMIEIEGFRQHRKWKVIILYEGHREYVMISRLESSGSN
jgi:hypothetical protein